MVQNVTLHLTPFMRQYKHFDQVTAFASLARAVGETYAQLGHLWNTTPACASLDRALVPTKL